MLFLSGWGMTKGPRSNINSISIRVSGNVDSVTYLFIQKSCHIGDKVTPLPTYIEFKKVTLTSL